VEGTGKKKKTKVKFKKKLSGGATHGNLGDKKKKKLIDPHPPKDRPCGGKKEGQPATKKKHRGSMASERRLREWGKKTVGRAHPRRVPR